ncbi:MAG: S8 family serine peptidase [Saprospiraceae bacterium]
MNLNLGSLLLMVVIFCCADCPAQQAEYLPGQLLVSLQAGKTPEPLLRRAWEEQMIRPKATRKVASLLNIWLFDVAPDAEHQWGDWLKVQREVRYVQFNHLLENRATFNNILPNDPLISQQWQYVNNGANGGVPDADLDAELAWNIATGGLTPAGDTIVLAVIDGGVDALHPDLIDNLWKNYAEVPGDNIDNDNNGYVDDFNGWNVYTGKDNITGIATGHGTPVSGIIGASGDNATGVTGINWKVKIMFVAGGSNEANILEAYDYVLRARRRYNDSNGQEGAFVVGVNCSWGTNYGQPSDAPLWCAAFDSLGAEGILSIAATANIPVNVDEVGDLPTTCPSDYLISVTSLTNADQKAANAAWGNQHVDLGAYGQEVFTAGSNGGYGAFSGTSFAAPQVSGAVALLYSAPCPNLIAMAKSNPAAAGLWVKDLILGSATPNVFLDGKTVTGGRLNLNDMLLAYESQCSDCPPPFAAQVLNVTTGSALLKWSEIDDFESVTLRWRETGAPDWQYVYNVENTYILDDLQSCTAYECSWSAACSQGAMSIWSEPVTFVTDGCCEPPAAAWNEWSSSNAAKMAWSKVTAAAYYRVRIRAVSGSGWDWYDVAETDCLLQNLSPCTVYEVQVQTICDTGATVFTAPVFFTTAGCGSCTDMDYCEALSMHADEEWIASVTIGNWVASSPGGGGYQDFTGDAADNLHLYPQTNEDVEIVPGFSALPYKEYFRIFIDFNMDGDFNDFGELAFNPGWATDGPVNGTLFVPDFQSEGLSRMRIMMKYKGSGNPPPQPCETFEFGQVEDYCVWLSPGPVGTTENPSPSKINDMLVYPRPARDRVWLQAPAMEAGPWRLEVRDVTGCLMQSQEGTAASQTVFTEFDVSNWPSGAYVAVLECGENRVSAIVMKR